MFYLIVQRLIDKQATPCCETDIYALYHDNRLIVRHAARNADTGVYRRSCHCHKFYHAYIIWTRAQRRGRAKFGHVDPGWNDRALIFMPIPKINNSNITLRVSPGWDFYIRHLYSWVSVTPQIANASTRIEAPELVSHVHTREPYPSQIHLLYRRTLPERLCYANFIVPRVLRLFTVSVHVVSARLLSSMTFGHAHGGCSGVSFFLLFSVFNVGSIAWVDQWNNTVMLALLATRDEE